MLFTSQIQPTTFFYLSLVGFCTGGLFVLMNGLIKTFVKNKIFTQIFKFFVYLFVFFACFFSNLNFNFGEFRLFSIMALGLSFFISTFFVSKFSARFVFEWYNKAKVKIYERFWRNKKI